MENDIQNQLTCENVQLSNSYNLSKNLIKWQVKSNKIKSNVSMFFLNTGNLKRANTKDRNAMSSKGSGKAPAPQAGLDVEFAKALRDFFVEMKDIQNGFTEMREFGLYLVLFKISAKD